MSARLGDAGDRQASLHLSDGRGVAVDMPDRELTAPTARVRRLDDAAASRELFGHSLTELFAGAAEQ